MRYNPIHSIIKKYLKDNEYDGLTDEEDCTCEIKELFSCNTNSNALDCYPAYKVKCSKVDKEKVGCPFKYCMTQEKDGKCSNT